MSNFKLTYRIEGGLYNPKLKAFDRKLIWCSGEITLTAKEAAKALRTNNWAFTCESCPICHDKMIINLGFEECGSFHCEYIKARV